MSCSCGDVAGTLRVVVTATNAGGSTPATSAQTAMVVGLAPANTVLPAISGTTQQGQTLSASTGTWTGSPTSFAYRWRACDASGNACGDITGATSASYVLQAGDVGGTLRVVVTATNGVGSTPATSAQSALIVSLPPLNTVRPSITGIAQVGQTLVASTGAWTDPSSAFTYRWRRCDANGNTCSDIIGATGATYAPAMIDAGSTLRVAVTATNSGGSAEATSDPTPLVVPALGPPANTGLPLVTGTAQAGQTLSASTGTWTESPTSFTYRWRSCDASGVGCADIAGATDSTYVVGTGDAGRTIRVVVTAANAAGSTAATSAATDVVTAAPANTVLPSIAGTAWVGQTLTATPGTWTGSPTSFAYRWRGCDATGGNCADIGGATSASYVLQPSDLGSTLLVVVTATNAVGSTDATSNATALIVPAPVPPVNAVAPAISGTARQDETLTATPGTWTENPTSFAYRWRDCDASGNACVDNGGTGATYVVQAADVGATLRVVVTATNVVGSTDATSDPTAVVALPPAPLNTALPSISGTAQQGQTLSASTGTWNGHPASFAYRWQTCDASGASCTDLAGASAAVYVPQSGDVGSTLRVIVTATNTGGSTDATSAPSAVVVSIPPANTALPTITGIAQRGQTLTASPGTWTGNPTGFAYRWRACDAPGTSCGDIAGETGPTYVIRAGDVGGTLRWS